MIVKISIYPKKYKLKYYLYILELKKMLINCIIFRGMPVYILLLNILILAIPFKMILIQRPVSFLLKLLNDAFDYEIISGLFSLK